MLLSITTLQNASFSVNLRCAIIAILSVSDTIDNTYARSTKVQYEHEYNIFFT